MGELISAKDRTKSVASSPQSSWDSGALMPAKRMDLSSCSTHTVSPSTTLSTVNQPAVTGRRVWASAPVGGAATISARAKATNQRTSSLLVTTVPNGLSCLVCCPLSRSGKRSPGRRQARRPTRRLTPGEHLPEAGTRNYLAVHHSHPNKTLAWCSPHGRAPQVERAQQWGRDRDGEQHRPGATAMAPGPPAARPEAPKATAPRATTPTMSPPGSIRAVHAHARRPDEEDAHVAQQWPGRRPPRARRPSGRR